jgi:hypothetical protein
MNAPRMASRGRGTPARRLGLLAALAVSVLLAGLLAAPAAAGPATSAGSAVVHEDPAVVTTWNALALTTIVGDTSKDPREAFLYIGFVQAAVYNAVVGIDGRFEPYHFHAHAPRDASAPAAAAAAAHRVLVTYFPYATATLDAALATSLSTIPDGPGKTHGVNFGELAANTLIHQRDGDGRYAPILFTKTPGPGVWRPTPPTNTPMAVPWMGFVEPLLIPSGKTVGNDFGKPPALTSRLYTRDFREVKAYGSATSTVRSPDQTALALFFSGNAAVQYNAALRDQVTVHHLDLAEAARMFAVVTMSQADAVIAIWWSKYVYGFWRPITAIQLADTDGNPATKPDTTWTPLLTTPPYPDYVSGYSGVTGAFTTALAGALGTRHLNLTLISTAVPGAIRTYDVGRALDVDVVDARVWLGIHFRFADTRGLRMGQRVADYALAHYFQRDDDD